MDKDSLGQAIYPTDKVIDVVRILENYDILKKLADSSWLTIATAIIEELGIE